MKESPYDNRTVKCTVVRLGAYTNMVSVRYDYLGAPAEHRRPNLQLLYAPTPTSFPPPPQLLMASTTTVVWAALLLACDPNR